MTDKELIQNKINELNHYIEIGYHTGRTYKLASKYIADLFSIPVNTYIELIDHVGGDNKELKDLVVKRLKSDFPNFKYHIYSPIQGHYMIKRESKNFTELAQEEIKKWKNLLNKFKED